MVKFENGNIRISVRNLVEFVLRSGDIDNRYTGGKDKDAMKLGSRIHRKIQGRMCSDYRSEVPIKLQVEYDNFNISVEGRADGVITPDKAEEDTPEVIIDEIKSIYTDVNSLKEPIMVHKAQAMCYGYMYGIQNDLNLIGIRMTYVNIESEDVGEEDIRYFYETYTIDKLEKWFYDLMAQYYRFAELSYNHNLRLIDTAKSIEFPFEYRKGQRDIVVGTYKSIQRNKNLFIQAPTGVGKTMSVIFPAVKSIGEGISEKIFYLTAKTITGTVALNAYELLRKKGLEIKSISITAKEKICVMEQAECRPDKCERAKGHFDRVNECMYELLQNEDNITREVILSYAEKHQVCPFELSLDLSYFADAVVCDYNYVFDPNAKLKRYFQDGSKGKYVFLVDEAHNLVDRAREMYSAYLCKEDFLEISKIIKDRDRKAYSYLQKCNKILLEKKRQCTDMYICFDDIGDFVLALERAYSRVEKILSEYAEFEGREIVLDLYFNMGNFLSIYDVVDDKYRIVGQISENGDFYIRLMCINPSNNLSMCMESGISTILFSATLLPVNYYKLLLSGDMEEYAIYIDSPFEKEKRLIALGRDVGTKYSKRNLSTYSRIAEYIHKVTDKKQGNYMIFFPSYKFMETIKEEFEINYAGDNIKIINQYTGMKEEEREEFLREFETEREETLVAFCVMGGIFSEGIDLTNEKLIGTIVVGTGFPQVCMERELIKEYFDSNNMRGFDYAYRYPGMNKVLQAAGRVIRTVDDVGVIVLLDERFLDREYTGLFPREWSDMQKVSVDSIDIAVDEFWKTIDF